MRAICCLAVVLASLHSADAAVVPSNAPARYWPAGVVRWAVDEASGASARDPLILEGTADWEFHTCLVFERCTLATCSPPFLKFKRSDASEATCTSDATGINPAASKITTITIGPHCGTGTMLSAIGHALGLENEQRRRDRAQHVKVIPAAIAAGKEGEFSQDAAFVDIGAYDYDSIVHDGSHSYSASGLTTIDAPHGQTNDIGQRNHINPLVSAAVNFVYNGCKAGKKGPSCMASYNTTLAPVTVTPGVSHLFTMALRSNDVFSIEIDSNLPAADAVVSAVTGDSFNAMGVVTVDFTPGSNTAGSAYTFKLTVKAGDGSSSTCSHAVRVASAFSCFGIDSSAAEVCSAHGKCTAHDKCSCSAAYEGLDCAGSISCSDVYTSFDTPPGGPWTDLTAATFGTDVYARGGTSLFLGSPTDDQSTGSAKLSVKTDSSPFKITFHAAVPSGAAKMDMRFKQADGTTCLTFIHNELGWGLDYFEADVPALPRQFDFIELRPSWLSSTTDLFINGHHVMHDQPFEESCLTGMSSVTVDANAWIDEFRILCSSGITMTGRVTEGDLGQEDFRSGGISITLEIVGDEWINTDANKEALVESLLADVYAGNGWSHQKRLMLTADLVSFSGAKATLGPLKGSAGYTAEAHEHVRFHLKPEMFTTGRVPEHDIEEVSFKIFGWCAVDVYLGFDRASEVIDNGNFGFSSEFFSGTGSMKVNKQGVAYIVPVEDLHPNHFVWYGKIAGNTELQATLTMGTSSVTTIMGKEGTFAILIDGDGQKMSAFAPGRWHKFRLLFDWDARTIDIKPDDILYDTIAMPDGMGPISRLMFQELQGTGGLIDSVHLSCDYRDPTVMMTPFCPRAGFESSSFVLNQGSDVLFEEDRLAVVPWRDDQNCADAATECQALNACSDSHGFFELKDSVITWKAGVLNLAPGGEYTICMFAYSYQMWFPLDEFVTCALGFTAAPATDAPGPTPPTNAPTDPPSGTPVEPPPGGTSAAPQEETPPPGSSSAPADTPPATPAETPPNTTAGPAETGTPASAPETLAPDTDVPGTVPLPNLSSGTPATTAPETAIPSTDAPATGATSSPAGVPALTTAPDTAIPSTDAPATGATSSPAGVPTLTTAPDTAAPSTDAPATGATSSPAGVPTLTTAPDTAIPSISDAPSTGTTSSPAGVPTLTTAPDTAAPSTAPEINAPAATGAPQTVPGNGTGFGDECAATPSPCDLSLQACIDMDQFASGNFMCVCLPPRSGSHVGGQPPECDAEDNDDESMDIWWIIIASVLGSMMLVCIVVTVLYWRAKKDLEHRRDTGYKEFSHQIDEDEMGTQNSEPAVNGGKRTGRDVELDAESFGEQSLNKIAVAPIPDDCPSLMSFRKLPIENPNDVSVEKDVFSDVASNANYVELNNASMNGTQHNQMFSPLASFGSFAMRRGSPAGLQSRRQSLLSGSDVSPRLDASPSPRGFDGSPRLDASLPPLGQTALSSSSPRHQASRRPSAAPSANFDPPITYLDI